MTSLQVAAFVAGLVWGLLAVLRVLRQDDTALWYAGWATIAIVYSLT